MNDLDIILSQLPTDDQRIAAVTLCRRLNQVCLELVAICENGGVPTDNDTLNSIEDTAIAMLIAAKRAEAAA